jgi:hypothetical protein
MELGKFARNGIESQLGSDVEAGVRTALAHYVRRLDSFRKPVAPPQFLDGLPVQASEADVIELPLGADAEAALREEALRHQVSVGELLVHAVLTYLSDRDRDLAATGEAGHREAASDVPLL